MVIKIKFVIIEFASLLYKEIYKTFPMFNFMAKFFLKRVIWKLSTADRWNLFLIFKTNKKDKHCHFVK